MSSEFGRHWTLDPAVDFLNHGSFGACPRAVQEAQAALRAEMEREPVDFFMRALEPRLDAARATLAAFVGADPAGLCFVDNATTGVNTALHGLSLAPGDELLVTDHAYNACRNALDLAAHRAGARTVVAHVPFPITDDRQVDDALLAAVTPRTRLCLLDHVTSPSGMVLPVARLVAALHARGVDAIVDGAHAPGMVPLDLEAIGAAWYTGNCHKWLCAPKGAGFLSVRADKRTTTRPLVISHGATRDDAVRSRLHLEFDWVGTKDPTPWLCVPEAIRVMGAMLPGGWPAVMAANRDLTVRARGILAKALGTPPPCPESMLGSLAAMPLIDAQGAPLDACAADRLHQTLRDAHRIEVPLPGLPGPPWRLVRVSCQLYNDEAQYRRLARVLAGALRGASESASREV